MSEEKSFGCTTFRKGNYLGRSYDFFCNSVSSSILHTGRIEGVRYESVGMSGSSFNGMIKDKALDGSIDKATMDTLFSSIVDGINENGVAISTLVVPKGDKGITTGTNPSKPSITARLVSRVVMDKAYSAKNAIKLLSELNIVQTAWNPEYELHWMLADANDTYIVETVNNKLSYLGPSAIEGIEDLYNGTLEADVITNFYQTGFKSTFNNNYVEGKNYEVDSRLYEVPAPLSGDEGYYYYANGDSLSVVLGADRKSFNLQPNTEGGELYDLADDNKYYILAKKVDGVWVADGIELLDEPLYHKDGTLVNIPSLFAFTEDTGESYNTFSMPVTNPTVTPYGAGLERYKIIKDKLAQVNGTNLADDEEAMEIINLVQYTTAYKNDTEWYSEFVSHPQGITNRTELTAIKNTGKLGARLDSKYQADGTRYYYEVIPPTDESFFSYYGSEKVIRISSESLESTYMALKGSYWLTPLGNWGAPDPDKWYVEITGTGYEDVSDIHYVNGERVGALIRGVTTSDFVDGVNEFKTLYAEKWAEGGKEAIRAFGDEKGDGASWHSNHQCVYDLANKKMLVYPSENGEHAFRVDIHGVVEDEAVEIGVLVPLIWVDKDSDGFKYFLARKEYIDENNQFHYSSPSNSVETIYCDACSFCGDFKNGGCTFASNTFNTALENNKNEYDGFCTSESFPITLLDGRTPVYTVSDEGGGETSDPDVN